MKDLNWLVVITYIAIIGFTILFWGVVYYLFNSL